MADKLQVTPTDKPIAIEHYTIKVIITKCSDGENVMVISENIFSLDKLLGRIHEKINVDMSNLEANIINKASIARFISRFYIFMRSLIVDGELYDKILKEYTTGDGI